MRSGETHMALSARDMAPPTSASYSGTVSPVWGSRAPLFLLSGGGWSSRLRPHVCVGLGLGGWLMKVMGAMLPRASLDAGLVALFCQSSRFFMRKQEIQIFI